MNILRKTIIAALATVCAAGVGLGITACAHEHKYGEWTDLVNTCTEHIQIRVCADCGNEQTQSSQPTGHVFEQWEELFDDCDEVVLQRGCTKCDFVEVDSKKSDGHSFGEWEVFLDTCTERTLMRVCEVCGEVQFRDALAKGHNFGEWSDWVANCDRYIKVRVCQDCFRREYEEHVLDGHNYGEWETVVDSCTKHTEVRICQNNVLRGDKWVPCGAEQTRNQTPNGHNIIAGRCVDCGTLGYNGQSLEWLDKYNSKYGYEYFRQNKYYAEQAFYNRIDEQARIFHVSNVDAATEGGAPTIVSRIDFSDLGLTAERAVSVWKTFKDDNPLYYWLSNSVTVEKDSATGKSSRIILTCYTEYAYGSDRSQKNQLIYSKVEEYTAMLGTGANAYFKALAFHDAIIEKIDYARDTGGKPESAAWAHNILGVFEETGGVCEAYTRAYQLLLNVSGVENICVTGIADNVGHSWNLVRLDNGNWYWCDLTWDDTPVSKWGISYNYFLVNDRQKTVSEFNFLDRHKPDTPDGTVDDKGVHFLYSLPERSDSEYIESGLGINKTFEIENMTFAVVGYNAVQLISTTRSGNVNIPETVAYDGVNYKIIAVGARNAEGAETSASVFESAENKTVYIPKTVRFIWDFALRGNVTVITVDPDNALFTSVDGVLFTKSMRVLVSYPSASSALEYVVPDSCEYVAYGAFSNVSNLKKVTLGRVFREFGLACFGSFYDNSINIVEGDLYRLYNDMGDSGEIEIHSDNPNFKKTDDGLYGITGNGDRLLYWFDKDVAEFEIKADVVEVVWYVFEGFTNLERVIVEEGNEHFKAVDGVLFNSTLTEIIFVPKAKTGSFTVPETITSISSMTAQQGVYMGFMFSSLEEVIFGTNVQLIGINAFVNCPNLKAIRYGGTAEEWLKIEKAENWCAGSKNVLIRCTDAVLDRDGNVVGAA